MTTETVGGFSIHNFCANNLVQNLIPLPSNHVTCCPLSSLCEQDTYRRRQVQRSVTRQMSFDLTKLMVTEDWFSDISPQTMRRLLNIVSVTGQGDSAGTASLPATTLPLPCSSSPFTTILYPAIRPEKCFYFCHLAAKEQLAVHFPSGQCYSNDVF